MHGAGGTVHPDSTAYSDRPCKVHTYMFAHTSCNFWCRSLNGELTQPLLSAYEAAAADAAAPGAPPLLSPYEAAAAAAADAVEAGVPLLHEKDEPLVKEEAHKQLRRSSCICGA